MVKIYTIPFKQQSLERIKKLKCGINWPITYIIHDDKSAYVGETTSALKRMKDHLKCTSKTRLSTINIISDSSFNKSVILDLESFLIKYMSADGKFSLQNGNNGIQNHNYYNKDEYKILIKKIWSELRKMEIVNQTKLGIENSEMFKYSPYKALSENQYMVASAILYDLSCDIDKNTSSSMFVIGGAGTGKSVLAVYLMKLLTETKKDYFAIDEEISGINSDGKLKVFDNLKNLKIGLVIPQSNFRKIIGNVFLGVNGLRKNMVLKPSQITKNYYDLLIVDESHRLNRRKNLSDYSNYDKCNERLGLPKEATQLDWIRKCSKHQIFFYDKCQTIKPSDIREKDFDQLMDNKQNYVYELDSQLRCLGGNDYINYLRQIFSNEKPSKKTKFGKYEFILYEDVKQMTGDIIKLDKKEGLCRNVAGYAWKWKTKGMNYTDIKRKKMYDIEIDSHKFIWNTVLEGWITLKTSIKEIGCIHTIQGCDLNYAGVIIGNDLKYDPVSKKIFVDKNSYFDTNGKNAVENDEELFDYIINIYITLMTRGIKGTFLYVCDDNLREYLKKYIKVK